MSDFLQRMTNASVERVRVAKAAKPEATLIHEACNAPLPPALAIEPAGFELIAEVKRRAPSAGTLDASGTEMADSIIAHRIASYEAAGAAGISVLTEPEWFDGALKHVSVAARTTSLPIMRKDFLVDPYQVFEARAAGASGVLVIVRMLDGQRLEEMLDAAEQSGLFALLELFGVDDVARAAEAVETSGRRLPLFVGVNTRNLATLEVAPSRLAQLAPDLPSGVPCVAESGIETADDARRVATLGYDAVLVGTALMRSSDPEALARELIAAGREEVIKSCT